MAHDGYKNKYFSVLGDSISTFEGYSTPEYAAYYDVEHKLAADVLCPADTWWGRVIDALGGKLLVNNSILGSTVCWHPMYEVESYGCSDGRTAALGREEQLPDVIMVFMGTNDRGRGVKILPNENEAGDLSAFSVAYRAMLRKLRKNYPSAEIWCLTPGESCCTAKENFEFEPRFGAYHIAEYCEAICACAAEYGCRAVDLYHCAEPYDTLEGLHPTASGMKTIADAVIEQLRKEQYNI